MMKKRKIFSQLMEQKNSKKISLVLGARQVGKTTVIFDNVKIYASGSSSITIKDHIQESLAGRKIINILHPRLDFI